MKTKHLVWIGIASCSIIIVVIIGYLVARQAAIDNITTFQACKDATGVVMESYPEQCYIGGKTFINDTQQAPAPSPNGISLEEVYIGMAEQEAIDKAERDGGVARVVERDGQGQPVTMDFREGRLNLIIKDGIVTRVDIEGRATDSPLNQ